MCLKSEFIGLAHYRTASDHLQRSTRRSQHGLLTKTEQRICSRLCPSPWRLSDSRLGRAFPFGLFRLCFESARIAITHMTPQSCLLIYVVNGAEPWLVPNVCDLPDIENSFADPEEIHYLSKRLETLARTQAIPGQVDSSIELGVEKGEDGGVSYDPDNHEEMTYCEPKRYAFEAIRPA